MGQLLLSEQRQEDLNGRLDFGCTHTAAQRIKHNVEKVEELFANFGILYVDGE